MVLAVSGVGIAILVIVVVGLVIAAAKGKLTWGSRGGGTM